MNLIELHFNVLMSIENTKEDICVEDIITLIMAHCYNGKGGGCDD